MAEAAAMAVPQMTLVDWLDDLTVRFLLNLPPAELSSVPRICFQIEEAQWFFEDFIRPANPTLPSLNLRQFLLALFQHCPLLQGFDAAQHVAAYEEFLSYKTRVPVRGAILLDDSMEKVLLVRGWKKGASWSFPRGKINKDEPDLDCAIREVYEETGFDIQAAGLVETNQQDGQVKAIDVTMKEQHMKLFVFRGVALDTHFEPKTRKEISKIQWYNVRDLPGFKKQKGPAGHGHHGQGSAQSSKFYMVAPFLGHLKKWIGQQRRDDAAAAQAHHTRNLSANHDGFQSTVTEDEGETEQSGTAHASQDVDLSAEELKRLLSVGAQPHPLIAAPGPVAAPTHTNNLLAMLKGDPAPSSRGSLPHTPFEQIDPVFPAMQPKTPQLRHPRQLSQSLQPNQPVPQFPYSPQRLGQQLSHPSFGPTANIPSVSYHPQQPFYSGHTVPVGPSAPLKPIGSEPSVPEPSKLPKLNAQSLKLLDAFKSTNSSARLDGPSLAAGSSIQKPGSQQQAALLDLFKKPSLPQAPREAPAQQPAPVSPALTEAAVKPAPLASAQRRTTTLNEITRTLPMKTKAKSPDALGSPMQPPPGTGLRQPREQREANARQAAESTPAWGLEPSVTEDQQSRGSRYDPANPIKFVRSASQSRKQAKDAPVPQVAILQRPGSCQGPQSPKVHQKPATAENGHPTPQFSILQRPGSSSGRPPRSPIPQSPLRHESPRASFPAQAFAKPTGFEASGPEDGIRHAQDKTGRLLFLLGKTPASNTPPVNQPAMSITSEPQQDVQHKTELLGLFNPDGTSRTATVQTPEPPPAPTLLPERSLSNRLQPAHKASTNQQQNLLNLFTKSATSAASSPGTPISPFTLGTPATREPPLLKQQFPLAVPGLEARSRLSSVDVNNNNNNNNIISPTPSGPGTPTSATPTNETKGLMLNYLNGVVQKEGYKSGKRG